MSDARPGRREHLRLPSVDTAAARHRFLGKRNAGMLSGCLCFLAAGAVPVGVALSTMLGPAAVAVTGLGAILLGGFFLRHGGGALGAWIAALGVGASLASGLPLIGVQSMWVPSGFAVGLLVLGVWLVHRYRPGASFDFHKLSIQATQRGCRIGFFRPFVDEYSEHAHNHLVPLLAGYGSVFFVTDESYQEADFDGSWAKEYEHLPGLLGGYEFTDSEWQKRVLHQLENIDIAVIDVSVPSPNVIWEIKQCYDHLPSHRIIFVASAKALDQRSVEEHVELILRGLQSLDANPTIQPRMLVYVDNAEGLFWLEHALHEAMLAIVQEEQKGPSPAEVNPHQLWTAMGMMARETGHAEGLLIPELRLKRLGKDLPAVQRACATLGMVKAYRAHVDKALAEGRPICEPSNPTYASMVAKIGEKDGIKTIVGYLVEAEERLTTSLEELRELTDQAEADPSEERRLRKRIRATVDDLGKRERVFVAVSPMLSQVFVGVPWEPAGPFVELA